MNAWPESRTGKLLAKLEQHHGSPAAPRLAGPFEMILWVIVAYLADDERRAKAFEALRKRVGTTPAKILKAPISKLVEITRLGGAIAAEERAARLRVAAELAIEKYEGDLANVLKLPAPKAKKALMEFPMIGEPGAEKILLMCGALDVLALESNGLRTLVRLGVGQTSKSYASTYRSVRAVTLDELPGDAELLAKAHLLLRKHGQEICFQNEPNCPACPVSGECPFFAAAGRRR